MLDGNPETPYRMQVLAREQQKLKLLDDINCDVMICAIEGWDPMEYIRDLRAMLAGLGGA